MRDPVDYHCLEPDELERFLLRRRAYPSFSSEMALADNLVEILRKANEFVPSSAGSILLDNPTVKNSQRSENRLHFIAAFGENSETVLSHSISAESGIAGHVYISGRSYYSSDVSIDQHFYSGVDELTSYQTQSLVAIPIRIEKEVCGVLELINRFGSPGYSERDLDLLEIFAGYISVSIQNVLDARQAQEIAKRDNLTGLYNDRYLHLGLSRAIDSCRKTGDDLAVLFMDLDRFKSVNDTFGHLAGSQVLRELGFELSKLVTSPGAVAARYGGDEFVLVVPQLSLEDALVLAETIRGRIAQNTFVERPGEVHTEPLHLTGLTCSVGIATMHAHIPDGVATNDIKSRLLRLADEAMYAAKARGRDCIQVADAGSQGDGVPLGRTFFSAD